MRIQLLILVVAAMCLNACSCGQTPGVDGGTDSGIDGGDDAGTDAGTGNDGGVTASQVIKHVIFIVKENRTYDSYFGKFPNGNGATTGYISDGGLVQLGRLVDMAAGGDHSWDGALTAYRDGGMNGFDLIGGARNGGKLCAWGPCNMVVADPSDLPNYWSIAQNYVLSDNFYSSLHGPSFPNHLFTIGAQSGGWVDGGWNGIGARDNPTNKPGFGPPPMANLGQFPGVAGYEPYGVEPDAGAGGCDSQSNAAGAVVVDPEGDVSEIYPCYDFPTLGDELDDAGISWRMYGPQLGSGYSYRYWTIYDAIRHIRERNGWYTSVVDTPQLFTDIDAGTLPAVSWVSTPFPVSEHPSAGVCAGENWTVSILNALGQSALWNSTAVFITWDDFGGFFDHQPPQQIDVYGLGFRVPLLIVSPYAVTGVDHARGEFSSVLKFIEDTYSLPYMTARDANTTNLFQDFNFSQSPRPWTPLAMRTGAASCP